MKVEAVQLAPKPKKVPHFWAGIVRLLWQFIPNFAALLQIANGTNCPWSVEYWVCVLFHM